MNIKLIKTKLGEVEYFTVGKGIPILFVHGGHSNCHDTLCHKGLDLEKFQLITPSRPGYGKTPLDNNKTPQQTAELIIELLNSLALEKVIIYGISAGGLTAIELASNYPNRVSKLILASAISKKWLDKKGKIYKTARMMFKPRVESLTWGMVRFFSALFPQMIAKSFFPQFSTKPIHKLNSDDVKELVKTLKHYNSGTGFLNDIDQNIEEGVINKIECPTLIIHSKNDNSVSIDHPEHSNKMIKTSTPDRKKLDLSVFHPDYKNNDQGRPAYDPAILLKIILFAYSKGITSSREIQWCCKFNIIFKALSCDTVPHFTTIARFITQHSQAIASVFEQIVLICHEEGLIGNELFAIDGCKTPSDASKQWSGTFKELEEKRKKIKRQIEYHMEAHQQQDKNDIDDEAQQKRRQQTIETLEKAHHKIDNFLKNNEPRKGEGKNRKEVKSNITDNDLQLLLHCRHIVHPCTKIGKSRCIAPAKPAFPTSLWVMKTSKGTIQGYNGLGTADKKHQVIIDAQAFGSGPEQHTLTPIVEAIRDRFQRLGIHQDIFKEGVILTADTGFASEDNMAYLHKNEIDAYIPDNQFRSRDPKFQDQRIKHPKPSRAKPKEEQTIPSDEFILDEKQLTCECPEGHMLSLRRQRKDKKGNDKIFFEGKVSQCRDCKRKQECMRNPEASNPSNGRGRQVSFIIQRAEQPPNYTDWMKERIDSDKGKKIYGHRMSVIGRETLHAISAFPPSLAVKPVFGNIEFNKKLNRFSVRGKTKVQDQWRLYCLVHNIEKIQNYGKIAA